MKSRNAFLIAGRCAFTIGGFLGRNYATRDKVVSGLIVDLIHEFEPPLSLDHGGAVTEHRALQHSLSSHFLHGHQRQEPFSPNPRTQGPESILPLMPVECPRQ